MKISFLFFNGHPAPGSKRPSQLQVSPRAQHFIAHSLPRFLRSWTSLRPGLRHSLNPGFGHPLPPAPVPEPSPPGGSRCQGTTRVHASPALSPQCHLSYLASLTLPSPHGVPGNTSGALPARSFQSQVLALYISPAELFVTWPLLAAAAPLPAARLGLTEPSPGFQTRRHHSRLRKPHAQGAPSRKSSQGLP